MSTPKKKDVYYGVIHDPGVTLHGPPIIDSDETTSLRTAFGYALDALTNGCETVDIVRCRYIGKDGNGYWGEDYDYAPISIDASAASWLRDMMDEEE